MTSLNETCLRLNKMRIACTSTSNNEDVASSQVFCFDFDGVVCDTVDESSTSAWLHAKDLWPTLPLGDSPEPFLKVMRQVRPVVETGWENTLLIRILSEAGVADATPQALGGSWSNSGASFSMNPSGLPSYSSQASGTISWVIDSILKGWEAFRDDRMQSWKLDAQELIGQYGAVRDKWISSDKKTWLAKNQPYEIVPDVMDAMMSRGAEVFIITTKQRRFVEALLLDIGLEVPSDHLFALEDGPKVNVLKSLLSKFSGKTFHFIEDKLGTLRKVAKDPDLSAVKLHLADWGYCTQKDINIVRAAIVDGVSLLSQKDLEALAVSEPWLS